MIGCKDWLPKKCLRCGAYIGASTCFNSFKGTKEEIIEYYDKRKLLEKEYDNENKKNNK